MQALQHIVDSSLSLNRAIIDELLPRFGREAQLLVAGRAGGQGPGVERDTLERLGVPVSAHDKLPDVVAYVGDKERLVLIDMVTSRGPIGARRLHELRELFKGCDLEQVYITALQTFAEFQDVAERIAWETEVWIAEAPTHFIHYNGDRFFGPR